MRAHHRRLRAWLLLIPVLLAALGIGGWQMLRERQARWREQAGQYQAWAAAEKDWILSCQLDSGLILYTQWDGEAPREEQTVTPYFSGLAALGLLSGTVTQEQLQGAERFLLWYLDHLNTAQEDPINGDGTVFDQLAIREGETIRVEPKVGRYDSVDSYAAILLLLADRYGQVAGPSLLEARRADLLRVLDALLHTLEENGLSHAKAEYPVQYLMDNCEVYAALGAAPRLLEILDAGGSRLEAVNQARSQLGQTIENILWNETLERYETGILTGKPLDSDGWDSFYPDSAAQLFPLCFGVLEPDDGRARALYEDFCGAWSWETLEHQHSGESTFAWCVTAYAAALLEDEERLSQFIQAYHTQLEERGRGYPLYTGDAGWMALACGHMEEIYQNKFW